MSRGFTLVELLLVVVIVMVTTGLALPTFVHSYRGAKLRTAARNIVMASRYARSVAVLHQLKTELHLYAKTGHIEVRCYPPGPDVSDAERFLEGVAAPIQPLKVEEDEELGDSKEEAEISAASDVRLKQNLPDDVTVVSVKGEKVTLVEKQQMYIMRYFPNGMCDEYTVKLMDNRGASATVHIDPMSARSDVTYSQR